MRRREYLALTVAATGLGGCAADNGGDEQDERNRQEDFDYQRRSYNGDGVSPMTFDGSGPVIYEGVPLDGGLTVFEATHEGDGRFVVGHGKPDRSGSAAITEDGAFDGAYATQLEGGEYRIPITTHGRWSVTISQPEATSGERLPVEFSGDSPIVYGPIEFTGQTVVRGQHDGDGHFAANIYEQESLYIETIVERGESQAEASFNWEHLGWVDVISDGAWSLAFEAA